MINLPQVTLVALGSERYREVQQKALDYSCRGINFGAVKNIIQNCNTIDDWNRSIIFDLHKYIDTEFCILIHSDGVIVNPEMWKDEWLQYDYIGPIWPLPIDNFSYRDEEGNIVRVGNSVSLRSKKLLELIATRPMEYHYKNNNEDGQICCWNRKWLESQGCKFAPLEIAKWFGRELDMEDNKEVDKPFLFHLANDRQKWGRNAQFVSQLDWDITV